MSGENQNIYRSPLFYVGDKYKLLGQLLALFPKSINNFYEPFMGGGSVFINVSAKRYFLNDIDEHLVRLHQFLIEHSKKPKRFFRKIEHVISKYNLSCSYKNDIVPPRFKKKYNKTYYARFNKKGYEMLRAHFNKKQSLDPLLLYVLVIYGFNRMMRFNRAGDFNLPVGNVDFNDNVMNALHHYFSIVNNKKISLARADFRDFLSGKDFGKNDFIYFDPPYKITSSEYNKLWDEESDIALFDLVDELNRSGVKFALSNVARYNGTKNNLFIKWMRKYNAHNVKSNYINYHDNGYKKIEEFLITNY